MGLRMPRKARIDAPGALHHVIARGIEKRVIFRDYFDRNNFVDRLGTVIDETETRCLAWALLPNHFHLLLKTGLVPIATVMRRLLTGHAVTFNKRHHRHGHLFQNRYKSILCQEDIYLKELVRYIHLNPIRAKIVTDMQQLDRYPFCGHSALTGRYKRSWQDVDAVLGLFGEKYTSAKRRYRAFVEKGVDQGRRDDLTGGGLLRSVGGWSGVKLLRGAKSFFKSDERILGDSEFVETVLKSARERMAQKYALQTKGVDLDKLAEIVSDLMDIETALIFAPGKGRRRVAGRSLVCFWAVRELGISLSVLSQRFDMSPSGISLSVQRGERLAVDNGYSLLEVAKL
jgi:REP element-mobilizing transposase RayT